MMDLPASERLARRCLIDIALDVFEAEGIDALAELRDIEEMSLSGEIRHGEFSVLAGNELGQMRLINPGGH